eukprot:CAMPEP_0202878724 /NCGR_PEP_ID=MMETSP1391-20130828/32636_1 /ASSEMBLY_ACC=CAM_ASM_000867 /TAXON_ID=1034604 /ORGANISM="Chlamydomonas leiostraca, Strain SAG 11-49" /LENGTH=39 /DNA_ID= /DNA_START= /DNA_END= /DNA_ORIENTATION=
MAAAARGDLNPSATNFSNSLVPSVLNLPASTQASKTALS